jgi:hypothetical protein
MRFRLILVVVICLGLSSIALGSFWIGQLWRDTALIEGSVGAFLFVTGVQITLWALGVKSTFLGITAPGPNLLSIFRASRSVRRPRIGEYEPQSAAEYDADERNSQWKDAQRRLEDLTFRKEFLTAELEIERLEAELRKLKSERTNTGF